jgi:hypothetical protein
MDLTSVGSSISFSFRCSYIGTRGTEAKRRLSVPFLKREISMIDLLYLLF